MCFTFIGPLFNRSFSAISSTCHFKHQPCLGYVIYSRIRQLCTILNARGGENLSNGPSCKDYAYFAQDLSNWGVYELHLNSVTLYNGSESIMIIQDQHCVHLVHWVEACLCLTHPIYCALLRHQTSGIAERWHFWNGIDCWPYQSKSLYSRRSWLMPNKLVNTIVQSVFAVD